MFQLFRQSVIKSKQLSKRPWVEICHSIFGYGDMSHQRCDIFATKASIPLSRRWQARPRILLLPHSQHIDIVKLASIVIRNCNDFSKSPILGAKKSMLELPQGHETLQSSEMMPKPTATQISSPGDIGKGVFQNPHFQSNC